MPVADGPATRSPTGARLRRASGLLAAVVAAALAPAPGARAQPADWPAKTVRIIVPAPAGGAYDRVIRPLAEQMAAQLKQPVIVENKPGAGNLVGTQAGAAAPPDGYTLTMTGMVNTIAQGLYERVPFDIVGDFAHIACIGGGAQWLVVHAPSGIASFGDLVEQARRAPGAINYATSGQGSTGHLLMELLQRATGTTMTHVPYKGGAPALQDVLAGIVPVTVIPGAGALEHVRSGRLRVLAVSSEQRNPDLPQVPTFAELGHRGLTVSSWVGLSAPKGTPPEIVRRVHGVVQASLARPDLATRLASDGVVAMPMSPEAYAQLVRSDTERWGQLVRSLNLKAN